MRVSVFGNRVTLGDLIVSGTFVEGVAGEAITALDVCYIKASDGLVYKLDTTISEVNTAIALMALEDVVISTTGRFMMKGTIEYASWTYTPGNMITVPASAGSPSESTL